MKPLILGAVLALLLSSIVDAPGVSESTASDYRKEAGALIADGYRTH